MKLTKLLLSGALLLGLATFSYAKCGDMDKKPMMGKCGGMKMMKDANATCDSNKSMKKGKCGNATMMPKMGKCGNMKSSMPKEMPMSGKCGKGKCGS